MYNRHVAFTTLQKALETLNNEAGVHKTFLNLKFTQLHRTFSIPTEITTELLQETHMLTCTISGSLEAYTIDLDTLQVIKIIYPVEENILKFYKLIERTKAELNTIQKKEAS